MSRLSIAILTAVLLAACIQADTDSGEDVVYANAEGPPTHIDASVVDAEPEPADAATEPDQWEIPDTGGRDAGESAGTDTGGLSGGEQLTVGPSERPAQVLLPQDYDEQREHPVVVLLHSYSMTAAAQDDYFGLSERLDDRDFILVLPEGTTDAAGQPFWNATDYCCDFYGAGPDDVGYVEAVIDETLEETAADPAGVHLFGHSNGAFLAYRLGCEAGSRLASIVALAGTGFASPSTCDDPDGQVSVVHLHGTHDAVVYYNGVIGAYPGASVMARRWAQRNGCSTSRSIDDYISVDGLVMGTETERRSHRDCPDDLTVELWTMYGSSHLPGLTSEFADRTLDAVLDRKNPDGP